MLFEQLALLLLTIAFFLSTESRNQFFDACNVVSQTMDPFVLGYLSTTGMGGQLCDFVLRVCVCASVTKCLYICGYVSVCVCVGMLLCKWAFTWKCISAISEA